MILTECVVLGAVRASGMIDSPLGTKELETIADGASHQVVLHDGSRTGCSRSDGACGSPLRRQRCTVTCHSTFCT